jgi:hypothetical protein
MTPTIANIDSDRGVMGRSLFLTVPFCEIEVCLRIVQCVHQALLIPFEGSRGRGHGLVMELVGCFGAFVLVRGRNPEPKQHRKDDISCQCPAEGRPPRQRLRASREV